MRVLGTAIFLIVTLSIQLSSGMDLPIAPPQWLDCSYLLHQATSASSGRELIQTASERYLRAMEELQIPVTQQINETVRIQEGLQPNEIFPAVLPVYADFFEIYPHARHLLQILTTESVENLKPELDTWTKRWVTDRTGYRVMLRDALIQEIHSNHRYSRYVKSGLPLIHSGEHEGFIETGLYMELLAAKILPVANDHDLLVHLPLFSIPEVAKLTEELANVYITARDVPKADISRRILARGISELVWQSIQEHASFSRVDSSGVPHLAVVGGYVHQFSWKWSRPAATQRLGPVIRSHLFSYPLEAFSFANNLDDLYKALHIELGGPSPSREAVALYSLLTNDMGLSSATWNSADAESKLFTTMVEDHLVPYINEGRIREGMDALALALSKSSSKFVRALVDHDQSLRFWKIHLEYARSLLN